MKLGDGVEQAIHCVTLLASMPEGGLLSAAAMAEFHGVSVSYLLKHLQALSGAGIVQTVPGPRGGYRLARGADAITLLDIVLAVEGHEPAFRCKEIRQNGPDPLPARHFRRPCQINAAMLRAERAYRNELRSVTVSDLIQQLLAEDDGSTAARGCAFFDAHLRYPKPKPKSTN
ncbi:Rrf2 family transcriptional regulator [Roseobacter sp. YSTF-M11]|uniref:Rrf2 family transcriptional regulator n=1 Tax=Roseobacter insulae TaxID=2859783 RepID=A0A9X1FW35_9RHOB|nr:Rrf2 family transcriptional regulator [Roseobacter insulae]MBW4708738.1 Rrf2 family transcriptional regulator [Roseobacter insulae]